MKSLLQFFFSLFFVSFLLGQESAFDPSHQIFGSGVDTAWVKQYERIIDSTESNASGVVIDDSGNVYVTGSSLSDYATIKYNSNGDMLWVRRYNGPGNDYASSLAVDGSGNVYVTGSSYSSGTSSDFATIKYNSNGDSLWVRRYSGPGNSDDRASSLAVDRSGNVYVTGTSYGSGTSFYVTIKYNSNGDTLWVRRYNGPGNSNRSKSLTVDGIGNVYVTGSSNGYGNDDYATIKYNSNGDTLWVSRYNGPGNGDDASSLAVDGSGNVYVTGSSVGSGFYLDYATIKYNSNGDTLWVRRYKGTGNWSYTSSLAVDGSGNVYVIGTSVGSGTSADYATIKYNSNGDTLWVRSYNGSGNSYEVASSLAVDGSGNVYVTGSSRSYPSSDYATIKYSSAGIEEWVARYSTVSYNVPCGICVDKSGNVFVGGSSTLMDEDDELTPVISSVYTTIKYIQTPTSVNEISHTIPSSFALGQNYPNPFNPTTTIRYSLPSSANVKLFVYDLLGREVATLVNEEQSAGWKEVKWNASTVSSGIYFYKLQAGEFIDVKKMSMIK